MIDVDADMVYLRWRPVPGPGVRARRFVEVVEVKAELGIASPLPLWAFHLNGEPALLHAWRGMLASLRPARCTECARWGYHLVSCSRWHR